MTAAAAPLFISYKHEEYEFALALAERLEHAGVRVWMDRRNLKTSDDWSEEIRKALSNCGGLIAILTPEYMDSKYCPKELKRAFALNRPVFPIIWRQIPTDRMPIELEAIQTITIPEINDVTANSPYFESLLADIRKRAGDQVGAPLDQTDRYLTSLITELESRAGILQYVELEGAWVQHDERPDTRTVDGFEPEFALLDDSSPGGGRVVTTTIGRAVEQNPIFVLTGESGTGKTTTIRKLASDAAKTRRENPMAPIPLFVYLPEWRNEPTPLDFLKKFWPLATDLKSALIHGDVLLYMDGLNEMGEGEAQKANLLRKWLHGVEAPKYAIVTCRTADYVRELTLLIPEVNCQLLSEAQIRQFAENYLEKAQATRFINLLMPKETATKAKQNDARSLIELARNPYLLAMLIYIFKNSAKGTLPKNTGLLFKNLTATLWERERKRRTPGWVEFSEMQKAFGGLAYAIIQGAKPVDVPLRWAELRLADRPDIWPFPLPDSIEKLVSAARRASIVDVRRGGESGQTVRFYHQLMQEYFAADEILRRGVRGLLRPPQFMDGRRVGQKWDLVVIAACGIASDPDRVVLDVAAVDIFLAAECIASGIQVSKETYSRVYLALAAILPAGKKQDNAELNLTYAASRAMTIMDTSAAGAIVGSVTSPIPATESDDAAGFQSIQPQADGDARARAKPISKPSKTPPTPTPRPISGPGSAQPASAGPDVLPASPTPQGQPAKPASGAASGTTADTTFGTTEQAKREFGTNKPVESPSPVTGRRETGTYPAVDAGGPGAIRVYLSDARTEISPFAQVLSEWLHQKGILTSQYGLGRAGDLQVPGRLDQLRNVIAKEVKGAQVIVVLLNDRTLDSEYVQYELQQAEQNKIPVVPIFREGADRVRILNKPMLGAYIGRFEPVQVQDRSGRFLEPSLQQILRQIQASAQPSAAIPNVGR